MNPNPNRRCPASLASLCLAGLLAAPPAVQADDSSHGKWRGFETVHARLRGFQEVPAVSSPGSGEFRATINKQAETIEYELSYEDLQGTPFQAHIHLGQHGVNGGISVWLCGNPPDVTPPSGTPPCPVPGGTVSGVLSSANVVGPTGQLIAIAEMAELIAAIRAGVTYVNVHTTAASGGVPGGEIRGQIR